MMRLRPLLKSALASCLLAAAVGAHAHDTWFHPHGSARPGEILLALGTGNQFPVQEYPVGAADLRQSGCGAGDDKPVALSAVRDTPTALIVHATMKSAALTCWAQLAPFDIELTADKVKLYLKEINAPQATHEAWSRMQARGVVWKERYTKHARIELRNGSQVSRMQPKAVGMGMDVLLESGLQAIHPGDPLVFQVLRDGAPLPDFAVELRSDQHRLGIWRKTDAQGRVRIAAPLVGKWVLRGTDLRLSESAPDTWESRFVTLAFEITPAASQNGNTLKLNTRSESHVPAIATITRDPPTKTSF